MKILFIATNSFPCNRKETLLESKINRLSVEFDYVFILTATSNEEENILLPTNVFYESINLTTSNLEKFMSLQTILTSLFWKEIPLIIKGKSLKRCVQKGKIACISYFHSRKYKEVVFSLLKKHFIDCDKFMFYFHSYWTTEFPICYPDLRKKFNKARFYTRFHAYDLYEERHNPTYLPFRKQIFSFCDRIFFISNQGRNYFLKKYAISAGNKLLVNYLGVDFNMKNFNKYVGIQHNHHELLLVSCSSMIPLKRINLIIDSLSLIETVCVKWVHFGDGLLFKDIQLYAAEKLGQKQNISFEFKGYVPNNQIGKFYQENKVDLFLNVSMYEGVPISIMEAMAYGIPCIGTDVGGVNEIITEKNGFLIDVDFMPAFLASVIEHYFKLNVDEKLAYRKNAMQLIDWRFNIKHNFDLFIKEIFANSC